MASTRSSTSPTFSPVSLITQPGKSLSYCRGIGDPLTSTAAPPDPAPSPSAYVLLQVDGFDMFDGEAKPQLPDGELGEAEQGIGAGERVAIAFAKARSAPPYRRGRKT